MIKSSLKLVCLECRRERTSLWQCEPVHGVKTVVWYTIVATDIEWELMNKPCPCGCYDVTLTFMSEEI